TRFWAKLDDVPIYALGEYMGSIPEDALVDYGKAVVEVDPSYFASVKYKDGVKSIMRLEFAELEKTDERLKFDERWKVRYVGPTYTGPILPTEYGSRTAAIV